MNIKRVLTQIFFPPNLKCLVCGRELFADTRYFICSDCLEKLSRNTKFCEKCGRRMNNDARFCDDCKNNERAFIVAYAPFIYENEVRKIVHKLKYGNSKYIAKPIAEFLADMYYERNLGVDLITFVPMHKKAKRQRGYNQAEEIAKNLGEILSLPVIATLEKVKNIPHLAKMKKTERAQAVLGAYELLDKSILKDKKVLLIDDVFTTGATVNACSLKLNKAKPESITVLTFATAKITPELY